MSKKTKEKRPSKYRIASILLGSDGKVWLNYVGYHVSQGGMEFGAGGYGFATMEHALDFYKLKFEKDEADIKRVIKEKEDEIK